MKTTENNQLIAEFMGCASQLHLTEHPITGEYTDPNEFEYHNSWDWIMPVIEKIECISNFDVRIFLKRCTIDGCLPYKEFGSMIEGIGKTKLEAVYNAVIEFINWYNKQKS